MSPISTLRRNTKLSPERRAAIIRAAMEEVAAVGIAAASINQIAKRAGMQKGLLYYYFSDRDEVLCAVVDDMADFAKHKVFAPIKSPTTAREFWASVTTLYRSLGDAMDAQPLRREFALRILQSLRAEHGTVGTSSDRVLAHPRRILGAAFGRIIAVGQQIGAVRTDVEPPLLIDTLFAVVPTFHRAVLLSSGQPPAREQVISQVVALLRGMLSPPKRTTRVATRRTTR